MLLLIDNYDSFSYNLYQELGELLLEEDHKEGDGREEGGGAGSDAGNGSGLQRPDQPAIKVIRNDAMTVEEIRALRPDAVILSPGPGRPADAGVCEALVRAAAGADSREALPEAGQAGRMDGTEGNDFPPVLGVCLGEQGICEALGGTVTYAKHLMHGKQSQVRLDLTSPLFAGLPPVIPAARYHSLAADGTTLPATLQVIAVADDGEVMGIQHRTKPIYGVQFHPESVMTPDGRKILGNFLKIAAKSKTGENRQRRSV